MHLISYNHVFRPFNVSQVIYFKGKLVVPTNDAKLTVLEYSWLCGSAIVVITWKESKNSKMERDEFVYGSTLLMKVRISTSVPEHFYYM